MSLPPIVGVIRLDAAQASRGLQSFSKDIDRAASKGKSSFTAIGSSAERGLLAMSKASLVAAGGAIKLASDYDTSLTHVKALVGASQEQTDQWSKQILDLAPKVGKAPKELADALYFVTSSGVDAAQAMDVVTVSAKAAAAGLGQTEVIADAVTSAMAAYGPEVVSAAQATDVLVATVREGKGEPEELASALGRVIAPAEAMGVTFGQVGGAVAAMSLIMPDVNEDVTGLRGVLTAISAPGQKAAEALRQYGLTADDVRRTIREKGLLAGLELVTGAVHGNQEALHAIFPDIRGFNAVQILTGSNLEKNRQIIDHVTNSTGALNTAWEKAGKDSSLKFKQSLASLEAAGIRLGNNLLPAATSIAGAVGHVADAFGHLPGPVQATVLGIGLLAGPMVKTTRLAFEARTAWGAYRAAKLAQVGVDAAVGAAETGLAARMATVGTAALGLVRLLGPLAVTIAAGKIAYDHVGGATEAYKRNTDNLSTAVSHYGLVAGLTAVNQERVAKATADAKGKTTQHTAATQQQTLAQAKLKEVTGQSLSTTEKSVIAHNKAAEALKAEQKRVLDMIPAFEGYKRNSDITAKGVLANLAQERDAFRTWAADTRTLLKRGLDPAIVKELSEKGPAYVHAFAGATDRQLRDLKTIFKERTNAAGDAAKAAAARKGGEAGRAAADAMERNFHPVLVPRISAAQLAANPRAGQVARNAFAGGGVLTEPVFGVGARTGETYSFAEAGPEAVVPLGARGGGGRGGGGGAGGTVINLTVKVSGAVGDADAIGRALVGPIREELFRLGLHNPGIFD